MQTLAGPDAAVVEFPIAGPAESREFAQGLLDRLDPALLIAIERCSPSQDGVYRNMRSVDISAYTARVDALFDLHEHSVGIGDGGNEIGMGLLRETIPTLPRLPQEPAWTACQRTHHNQRLQLGRLGTHRRPFQADGQKPAAHLGGGVRANQEVRGNGRRGRIHRRAKGIRGRIPLGRVQPDPGAAPRPALPRGHTHPLAPKPQ